MPASSRPRLIRSIQLAAVSLSKKPRFQAQDIVNLLQLPFGNPNLALLKLGHSVPALRPILYT
jgi:hypothetical protein